MNDVSVFPADWAEAAADRMAQEAMQLFGGGLAEYAQLVAEYTALVAAGLPLPVYPPRSAV